jgi:exosortase
MRYANPAITSILFILLFFPLFPSLAREWMTGQSQNYSHGFMIPLLSLYFLWHDRDELSKTAASPSMAGILIMLAGLVFYVFARAGYQLFFQCLSMLVVLFGVVYAQAGSRIASKTAFAISYLVLMIPIPTIVFSTIAFHLRMFTAKPVYLILRLMGMNANLRGNIIDMPTCSITIASECSGFRGFTVFAAASLAIGYLLHKSIRSRVILFVSAMALALVMNVVRIVSIAVITDMLELDRVLLVVDRMAGYVVLMIGVILLFGISDLLKEKS